jgi:excisionase family DNA binding protein
MENVIQNKNAVLYNEKITAKRLGLGYSTLRLLRQQGKISHVRVGRRVFYRLTDIENFIARSAVAV